MEPSSRKQPSAAAPTDPSSLDTRGRQTQEIFHAEGLVNQLTTQAHNFLILFQRSGVTENLDKSIQCQNQAVHLTPDEHVTKLSHMNDLGGLYLRRFQRLGELTDLDKAIDCHDIVVAATPDGDMGKPSRLNNLSVGYRLRFDHAGKLEDMDNAIQCLHEAIETTDDDHPRKPGWLNNLGNVHHSRFKRLGEINDIQKAIECHTLAVAVTPDNQRTKPTRQNNLANAHQSRFELLGELEDLENAIQYHSQAVQCIEDGHEDKPLWLSNLGHSYELRFMSQGDTADLEHSISYLSEAVSRTPQDHPDMPRRLSNLGSCWIKRYERGGEPDDLDKGFQYLTSAVEHIPEGHEAMPDVFSNLAVAHQRRFEHLGNPEELDKATHWSNLAATVIPENHKERPAILANLGNTYSFRFGCSGDPEDINQAIRYLSQAASLAPDNHTSKPAWLSNLGSYHADRFGRLGELTDLNHAMEYTDRAISLLPDGHAERPRMLANLGDSYVTRYERLGELDDIDRAIDNYSQAARSTQDGHGHRARILSDLGSSHLSRFDRLREPLDINIAVEYQCQAVALTPDGHAEMPKRLNNLAITYYRRFSQLGDIADNDKSIGYLNQAVDLTDDGHGDKPIWLGNLGGSYFQRFEHLGEMSDLQKVIDYTNRAVELSPIDHADNLTRLKNLGVAYWSRFQRLRVAVDIDKALDCMNRAAELTPDDHAQKPDTLTYLGMICIERSNYLGDHQIFSVAIEHFRRAAQSDNGPPHARFRAARNWASLSDEKSSKLLAFQRAMELLPHLIWLGTTIDQRYSFITMMGDVTTEAAAFAISYGASGQALEWLEQGRSIVWNQILQLRTPFEELVDIDPYLAQRLEEVGRELERAGSRSLTMPSLPNYKSDLEQEAQNHHRLAVEWDRLLKQARQLPEFGDFLRPHTTATLTRVAKDGPVVVINIHQSRCDALVIQRNCEDIAHIPLQRFSAKKAMEIRSQIAPLVGRQGSDSGTRYLILNPHKRPRSYSFDVMLAALWTDVAKPILEFLGFTRPLPVEELPHITWCTTGALSFLPVHAAGCYDGSHPSIFDLVISSYTPTLSALLAITPQTHNHQSGILAIGQESTEGMTRLPCTRQELNVIREHAQNTRYSQLEDEKATVNTVFSAMDNYSWIHLACHATQQAEDPAKSAFHLHDGNLMLSAITQRSFQNKGLAFLSACQTAAGSKELPDEALHLAAGMLMAGYPSVIATMWAIQDEDAPEVAQGVYEELLKDGKMDCTKASRALHRAMGHLRAKIGERSYERWVPFVHIGV